MTNTTEIDWSKAPEDATHYNTINDCWYRAGTSAVADIRKNGVWEESIFTPKELRESSEELCSNRLFVSRPVQTNKPPTGLMPKNIWIEQMQAQRRNEITAAMQRYIEAGKDIPNNWLQELIELNNVIQNVQPEDVEDNDVEPKWIEWGVNEQPVGLEGKIVERQYVDGEYRTGGADDFTWNTNCSEIDRDTVARYRVVGEDE